MLQLLIFVSTFIVIFLPRQAFAAMYELAKDYSGEDFFDGWDFFDGVDDVTGGDQIYSDAFLSAYKLLAFVESDTKHAFLRVDNYTNVPRSTPRRSVRVVTKASYHMAVTNTGLNSYGPSFNNGHGGVFITEYSSSGIS
ncbi:hypothetical protein BDQ17DRAFT_1334485 [Cyathus striatus]|nr:hypothetical protein BDQ17DRAFT_1334485 [Cyathus striatus]